MPETKGDARAPSAAESLEKKSVRTSPMLWILGAVFAGLLGWLGTQALSDLADLFHEPQQYEFHQAERQALQSERNAVANLADPRQAQTERAQSDLHALEQTLSSAEQSFRTWLATRATLGGSPNEDQEVRARRDRLDALRNEHDRATLALQAARSAPDPRAAALAAVDGKLERLEAQATREYESAHAVWKLKVLATRLGVVLPVWALAIVLWSRRQSSRYVTLLWGYWAFSVWMLLWGIGPYLPHYGGYIPLGIGVLSSVWLSVSLVRYFNRRAPLRRRRLVDKAIARHRCPNCERDYLIGQESAIDLALGRKGATRHFDRVAVRPRACSACGLPLFGNC
ncbi:MAG TPA: hypothetical protein VEQ59_10285, partial [Polyangiaceae bacterium]|nr:hypothetical protein [Polyangiaceae bacterium]